jgi:hypothetical protein
VGKDVGATPAGRLSVFNWKRKMTLEVGRRYQVKGNRNITVKITKKSSNPVWCFHDDNGCSYKEDGTSYHGSFSDLYVPSFVIESKSEEGYWSNSDGWGDLGTATYFNPGEFNDFPISKGDDAKLVKFDYARYHRVDLPS